MPKRKRDDREDVGANFESPRTSQGFAPKIHHGQKLLQRSFKLAKGFERQKLGRRRKTAIQSRADADVKRIDHEIEALKTLELATLAETQLSRIVERDRSLSSSSDLSKLCHRAALSSDIAHANVIARLCNSNPVKQAAKEVTQLLHLAIGVRRISNGIEPTKSSATGGKNESPHSKGKVFSEFSEDSLGLSSEESTVPAAGLGTFQSDTAPEEHEDVDMDDDEALDEIEARLLGSGSDSNSDEDDPRAAGPLRPNSSYDHANNLSLSPSPSISDSDIEKSMLKKQASNAKPSKGGSAFVPSLTMSGYWSGTESEASDMDKGARGAMAQRKNRRGQRARQQIWEKKFGGKAKHIQKNGQSVTRDAGWDPKRGATDAKQGPAYRPGWTKGKTKDPRPLASASNAIAVAPRKVEPAKSLEKGLHPSWEAAKKAKERAGDNAPAFAGSKVVFD